MPESFLQWSELLSYLVTVVGLPLAIYVFLLEQRKERQNEEEERMDKQRRRLWQSWEDYMREWCKRRDFREALPELLMGEDPDFARDILLLAGLDGTGGPRDVR